MCYRLKQAPAASGDRRARNNSPPVRFAYGIVTGPMFLLRLRIEHTNKDGHDLSQANIQCNSKAYKPASARDGQTTRKSVNRPALDWIQLTCREPAAGDARYCVLQWLANKKLFAEAPSSMVLILQRASVTLGQWPISVSIVLQARRSVKMSNLPPCPLSCQEEGIDLPRPFSFVAVGLSTCSLVTAPPRAKIRGR